MTHNIFEWYHVRRAYNTVLQACNVNVSKGEMKFSTEKKTTLCIYTEADYGTEKVTT